MISVLFGKFGLPHDWVAGGALALAAVFFVVRRRVNHWLACLDGSHSKLAIAALAIAAALGSVGYYTFYLRGGPRIVDATYYWLQAKTFASGHLTLPLLQPTAALRGRFLYYDADHARLSVLFPPGYGAVLALGVLLKSPQVVGAGIAAGLVFATAALARRVFEDTKVSVVAAVLSVVCVALRYHTADTMSHGWAALLFALAIYGAFGSTWKDFGIAGLCTGWLIATRPVTALAVLVIVALVLWRRFSKSWLPFLVGILPGVAAWLLYQRVTTGSWFYSTQLAYYAVSDGPPGCFRYGFGSAIGCQFEHGDFIAKRMPYGYGISEALTVTGVRLRWHLLDVLNFEPLALLLFLAGKYTWRRVGARPLLLAPLALLVVYAPFYFDGNYPGGGARLLADVLPIEHVLIAAWICLPDAGRNLEGHGGQRLVAVLTFALLGFSMHASFEHRQLAQREGGRPMFEAEVVSSAGVRHGLILVGTDHGFALGHEPGMMDAQRGLVVARERGDAHDRLLWQRLGSPAVYRYDYPFTRGQANPKLQPLVFNESNGWRFEAEAEWPALAVHDSWAIPGFPPTGCVSARRALVIHPTGSAPGIDLALPVPRTGRYRVNVGWVAYDDQPTTVTLKVGLDGWKLRTTQSRFQCGSEIGPPLTLSEGEHPIRFEVERMIAIDWFGLVSAD